MPNTPPKPLTNDQRLIAALVDREGGYSNRAADRGGPTNFGITQATLSNWLSKPASADDVRLLTREQAAAIYAAEYLTTPGISLIADDDLRELVFDGGVQHGVDRAVKWLQAVVGTASDGRIGPVTAAKVNAANTASVYRRFLARRMCFYGEIITADAKRGTPPAQSQAMNALGWMNRMAPFIEAEP